MQDETVKHVQNPNLIYQDKFQFTVRKLPNTSFFCSSINVPGIRQEPHTIGNPLSQIRVGGTKVYYDDLSLTFRVDEDLNNYIEIHKWIVGIGKPQSFQQHKDLVAGGNSIRKNDYSNIFSDGILFTLSNVQNYNVMISFKDLQPTSLSPIDFNFGTNAPTTATVTFVYNWFEFEKVAK